MAADVYRIAERFAEPRPVRALAPSVVDDDLEYVNCAVGVANPWFVDDRPIARDLTRAELIACIATAIVFVLALAWYAIALVMM